MVMWQKGNKKHFNIKHANFCFFLHLLEKTSSKIWTIWIIQPPFCFCYKLCVMKIFYVLPNFVFLSSICATYKHHYHSYLHLICCIIPFKTISNQYPTILPGCRRKFVLFANGQDPIMLFTNK